MRAKIEYAQMFAGLVLQAPELRLQTASRQTSLLKYWDYTQLYQYLYASKTHTCPEVGFASGIHKEIE